MPNLLAGKLIVPEFIQSAATVENISRPVIEWIKDPKERRRLRTELLSLRTLFGSSGASERAARVILEKGWHDQTAFALCKHLCGRG